MDLELFKFLKQLFTIHKLKTFWRMHFDAENGVG